MKSLTRSMLPSNLMRPILPALRRLVTLSASLGLLGQSLLPAAHSWEVAAEESAYHASVHDAAPRASLCDDHDRSHHHHSDRDCPLCPLFSSARASALHGACAAGAPDLGPSLLGVASGPCSSAEVAGAPVRGPPAHVLT